MPDGRDWDDELERLRDRFENPSQESVSAAEFQGGYWDDDLGSIYSRFITPEMSDTAEAKGQTLFYEGWVNPDLAKDERNEAREDFYDWMVDHGWELTDFPWDEWREWYKDQ